MSSTTTTTTTTTTTATTAATPSGYTTGTSLKAKGVSRLDSAVVPDYREVRRRDHHEADIVIVGAGIVGCAAAVAFGKQGRSVILLERSLKEPDRIVGELLQPGGVRALEKLGMRGRSMSCLSCYYRLLPPTPFPRIRNIHRIWRQREGSCIAKAWGQCFSGGLYFFVLCNCES